VDVVAIDAALKFCRLRSGLRLASISCSCVSCVPVRSRSAPPAIPCATKGRKSAAGERHAAHLSKAPGSRLYRFLRDCKSFSASIGRRSGAIILIARCRWPRPRVVPARGGSRPGRGGPGRTWVDPQGLAQVATASGRRSGELWKRDQASSARRAVLRVAVGGESRRRMASLNLPASMAARPSGLHLGSRRSVLMAKVAGFFACSSRRFRRLQRRVSRCSRR